MRELFYKIKQFGKCRPVDLHRNMLSVKYDAVLIVIYIRRILESPFSSVDSDGDDPVVLSGRMIQTSGIAFILHTELTLGIAVVLRIFGRGNSLWILLRLGQVDGNVDLAIWRIHLPLHVLLHPVAADVVTVPAEFIIICCRLLRRMSIVLPEFLLYLGRSWKQAVHQFCIKQISVSDAVLDDASLHSFRKQLRKHLL